MKKIDVSSIAGTTGMPVKSGSLLHLQSAYSELFLAIFSSVTRGRVFGVDNTCYVIYGCENYSVVGAVNNFRAGALIYNGEIFLVDAVSVTLGGGQVVIATIDTTFFTAANADPVLFTDAISRSVHQIRKVKLSAGTTGTGISDFSTFNFIEYSDELTPEVSLHPLTPGYNTGWTRVTTNPFGFHKDISGLVRLRGKCKRTSTSNLLIINLPVGFRPSNDSTFVAVNTTTSAFKIISITGGGDITIDSTANGDEVAFDAISFYAS